jgi:hypothetical protein
MYLSMSDSTVSTICAADAESVTACWYEAKTEVASFDFLVGGPLLLLLSVTLCDMLSSPLADAGSGAGGGVTFSCLAVFTIAAGKQN